MRMELGDCKKRLADLERERDEARALLKEARLKLLSLPSDIREGNVMLDNEPIIFVKGYEQACADFAAGARSTLVKIERQTP